MNDTQTREPRRPTYRGPLTAWPTRTRDAEFHHAEKPWERASHNPAYVGRHRTDQR